MWKGTVSIVIGCPGPLSLFSVSSHLKAFSFRAPSPPPQANSPQQWETKGPVPYCGKIIATDHNQGKPFSLKWFVFTRPGLCKYCGCGSPWNKHAAYNGLGGVGGREGSVKLGLLVWTLCLHHIALSPGGRQVSEWGVSTSSMWHPRHQKHLGIAKEALVTWELYVYINVFVFHPMA